MKLILNEFTVVFVISLSYQSSLPFTIELNSRYEFAFTTTLPVLKRPIILVSISVGQVSLISMIDTILEVSCIVVSISSEHILGLSRLKDVILEDSKILGAVGVLQAALTITFTIFESASIGCIAPGHNSFTFDPIF